MKKAGDTLYDLYVWSDPTIELSSVISGFAAEVAEGLKRAGEQQLQSDVLAAFKFAAGVDRKQQSSWSRSPFCCCQGTAWRRMFSTSAKLTSSCFARTAPAVVSVLMEVGATWNNIFHARPRTSQVWTATKRLLASIVEKQAYSCLLLAA